MNNLMLKLSNNLKLLLISLISLTLGLALIIFGVNQQNPKNSESITAIITVVPSPQPSQVLSESRKTFLVVRVVDGDTFEIEGGAKVRLVGIDTPETVDPRRPVGCFGKEASQMTKSLIEGKMVYLEKDVTDIDRYDRLLRYVYLILEDNTLLFVNDYLVREGYAKNYTYPPDVKFNQQFLEAERTARENKKGLWGKC